MHGARARVPQMRGLIVGGDEALGGAGGLQFGHREKQHGHRDGGTRQRRASEWGGACGGVGMSVGVCGSVCVYVACAC